ncbi:hypothetical protein [Nonlabens dokdonensis]|uniref:hypothetical protein n=1 Tax=Nonlabens dokdonensis TaxID=328515 RepID=UPI0026F0C847|nr:hypothetical protein [Nonlabens dokdonensis]
MPYSSGMLRTYLIEKSQSPRFIWWLLSIVVVIAVVLFFRNNYSRDLERAQLLKEQREELIELRFRESVIQQELLCKQDSIFKNQIEDLRSQIQFKPYEKPIYIYYGADDVLRILNSAKY